MNPEIRLYINGSSVGYITFEQAEEIFLKNKLLDFYFELEFFPPLSYWIEQLEIYEIFCKGYGIESAITREDVAEEFQDVQLRLRKIGIWLDDEDAERYYTYYD